MASRVRNRYTRLHGVPGLLPGTRKEIMETFIGCSVIIYNSNNEILIAQRSHIKKRFPLLWETIGGAVEENETPEECIRRETMEEIGCDISELELFKVYIVREENEQHILIVFKGIINQEICRNVEIKDTKWISEDQLNDYTFYSNNCIKKLTEFFTSNIERRTAEFLRS